MNVIRELLVMLWDSVKHGDLTGHLRAWRLVATGRITLDTTAADCLDARATIMWNLRQAVDAALLRGMMRWCVYQHEQKQK